jgi:hypothetical protein
LLLVQSQFDDRVGHERVPLDQQAGEILYTSSPASSRIFALPQWHPGGQRSVDAK